MMEPRTKAGIITALLLAGAALFLWRTGWERPAETESWREEFIAMGTIARFTFYTGDADAAERASRAAKAVFSDVSRMADIHLPDSELSRLNASAASVPFLCSPELFTLLKRAQRAHRESGGRFDVTVKPLMDLWGFYRKRGEKGPTSQEIRETLKRVGFEKVILNEKERSVRFSVPGMALDFGGIAKGYALDLAARAAEGEGIRSGVLDLGGNLRFLRELPPGKRCYTVGIRDPQDKTHSRQILSLPADSAVATSGDYERFIVLEGKRYGHIISPLTGMPVAAKAVTVTAKRALDADILSTSCYLAGEKEAQTILSFCPGSTACFSEAAAEGK